MDMIQNEAAMTIKIWRLVIGGLFFLVITAVVQEYEVSGWRLLIFFLVRYEPDALGKSVDR